MRIYRASRYTEAIDSSEKASVFFRRIWNKKLMGQQEQVYVVYMDEDLYPIEWPCIHIGGQSRTVIDAKIIVERAIQLKAAGVFIAHNHPRGGLTPRAVDINRTRKVIEACRLFDIKVFDHIILTLTGYTSFQEKGLID